MLLLDQMIRMGSLADFVYDMVEFRNTEKEDRDLWEFWLHRVYGVGFEEFRNNAKENKEHKAAPTQEEVKSIVTDSMNTLACFVPQKELVNSGTVQAAGNNCSQ